MFCITPLQEKYAEYAKKLHMVFIDLEKAYNTISKDLIWYYLIRKDIPEAFIYIFKDMYDDDSITLVSTRVGETGENEIKITLHKGSVLSPLLFIIIMDVYKNGL